LGQVPSLERAIAILRLFNRSRRLIAAPEISQELVIPRSTTHRVLQALVDLELLRREPGDLYATGHGVLTLGFEHLAAQPLTDVASPILSRLRDQTNCTAHLAVLENRNTIYILRHLTPSPFTPTISIGASVPAHATVMGRMLLLDKDAATIRRLFRGVSLQKFTDRTPRSVDDLLELIEIDRARGYALSEGFFGNVAAVAAPVRNASGAIVAGISVVAAQGSELSLQISNKIKDAVIEAANEISRALGVNR
jgi:DNA-binding IclR family transcriptional regulator